MEKLNKENFDEEYNSFEKEFYKLIIDRHFKYDSAAIIGVLSVGLLDYIHTYIRDDEQIKCWKEDFDEYFDQLFLERERKLYD